MDVTIRVNGKELGNGRVPQTASVGFTPNDSFDVGRDTQSPVSKAYFDKAPYIFTGRIADFTVDYL